MQNEPHQGGHTAGYAIVVVMLFTLLTLVIVTMTVASVTVGNRQTTGRGQQGDRALMAANSGLTSFLGLLREKNFRGEIYDLPCFVDGGTGCLVNSPMDRTFYFTSANANGPQATWEWVKSASGLNYDADNSTFQLKVTGNLGDGTQTKAVVTQVYDVYTPASLNISAPAALTSCMSINAGGTSRLSGNANPTGIIPLTSITSATPNTISPSGTWPSNSITVQDGSAIKRGSYITVDGQVFRVGGKFGINTFSITPPNPDSTTWPTRPVNLKGSVNLVPIATSGQAVQNSNQTITLPASDVSSMQAGDTLYVTIGGTRYGLTVVSTNSSDLINQSVTVSLGASGPGANTYDPTTGDLLSTNSVPAPSATQMQSLPWGTPLARYIMGATSAGNVQNTTTVNGIVPANQWGGASAVTPAAIARRSTLRCGDGLFQQSFNMTKQDYLSLSPIMLSTLSPTNPLKPDLYWLGPKNYPSGQTYTLNNNALCGGGILVVNGDLNLKGTGNQNGNICDAQGDGTHPTGFTGIIYVMGSLSNQGNSDIHGALIVEGNTSMTTNIGGNMNINYDDSAILKGSGRMTPPVITARPGTWRQQ